MTTSPTGTDCAARTARSKTSSTTSARSETSRRRRAVTLIELLIAIALLVAMAALAVPMLADRLSDRAFDHAIDAMEQQLLLARSHAQTLGQPVEVVYLPQRALVIARLFDSEDEQAALSGHWAVNALPDGVRIAEREPDGESERERSPYSDPVMEEPASAEPLRLAVFLPDGSALPGRTAWVIGENGRAVRLSMNPWTGFAALQPRADRFTAETQRMQRTAENETADERR